MSGSIHRIINLLSNLTCHNAINLKKGQILIMEIKSVELFGICLQNL